MAQHDPPLVQHYERMGGEREARWGQLVADEAVPLDVRVAAGGSGGAAGAARSDRLAELEWRGRRRGPPGRAGGPLLTDTVGIRPARCSLYPGSGG